VATRTPKKGHRTSNRQQHLTRDAACARAVVVAAACTVMDDRDDLSGMAPLVPERQERKFVGRSADGQRVVLFNEPPLHPGATQSAELWQASAGAFGASEAIPQLSRCQSGLAGLRHPLQCGLLPPSLSPSFVMPSLEGQGSPLNLAHTNQQIHPSPYGFTTGGAMPQMSPLSSVAGSGHGQGQPGGVRGLLDLSPS